VGRDVQQLSFVVVIVTCCDGRCLCVSSYDDSWLAGYPAHMMPPPPVRGGARFFRPPGPTTGGRAGYRAAGGLFLTQRTGVVS